MRLPWSKFLSKWTLWAGFHQILTTDRRLHNRRSFAPGLKSNGLHLRQAGTKAPDRLDEEGVVFEWSKM